MDVHSLIPKNPSLNILFLCSHLSGQYYVSQKARLAEGQALA